MCLDACPRRIASRAALAGRVCLHGKEGLAVQGGQGSLVLCSSGLSRPAISNRNSSGLEFRLTYRKQSLVPKSNRNKSRLWGFEPLHCDLSPCLRVSVANPAWASRLLPISNRQIRILECPVTRRKQTTATRSNRQNSRNRRCGKASRPSPQTPRPPFVLIDTQVETEFALSHRKQTTATNSDRYISEPFFRQTFTPRPQAPQMKKNALTFDTYRPNMSKLHMSKPEV